MAGKVVLSVLQKGKGHISHVSAEIEECGIEPPTNVDIMKWKEVVDLLWINEYKRLVELELARDIGHWKMVKKIAPQSDRIMELFEYQDGYFLDKQPTALVI